MKKKKTQKIKVANKLVSDNFFGGIAWGIGAIIGASFLIAILGKLNLIPFKLSP